MKKKKEKKENVKKKKNKLLWRFTNILIENEENW